MRNIEYIVIHHSESTFGDAATIDRWHKDRGFCGPISGKSIGYHWVILNGYRKPNAWRMPDDGAIEQGRAEEERGAAVKGHNEESVHVCLIGKTAYSRNQWTALRVLVTDILKRYPAAQVVGHKDLEATDCPDFDAKKWWSVDDRNNTQAG
jgi:hypothetical protein